MTDAMTEALGGVTEGVQRPAHAPHFLHRHALAGETLRSGEVAAARRADFGVLTYVAEKNDFVDTLCHVCSVSRS